MVIMGCNVFIDNFFLDGVFIVDFIDDVEVC